MFATTILICLVAIIVCGVLSEDCDKDGILLYEDLGCTPHYEDDKKCPVSYTCKGLEPWKNNECHFRGKIYTLNEIVDDSLATLSCSVACFCSVIPRPSFTCAILDCPEWLGSPIKSGCYRKYSLDTCCSTGSICPSENTAECLVDGTKYKEGQKIHSKNTCSDCICQKGFGGKFEKPFCMRRSCGIQLKHSNYLQNICAPLYSKEYSKVKCCPDSWICASGYEIITGRPASEKICIFGKISLKVGQSFEKWQTAVYVKKRVRVICECVIPPLLTCTEIY